MTANSPMLELSGIHKTLIQQQSVNRNSLYSFLHEKCYAKFEKSKFPLTLMWFCRLLGDTKAHQRAVLDCDGLKEMADLLKSQDKNVIISGIKGIMAFTNEYVSPTKQNIYNSAFGEDLLFKNNIVINK